MKKLRTTLIVAAVGAAAFLALTGFRHARGGPEAWMTKKLDRVLSAIDATPEQRSQIEAIRDELMAKRPQHEGDRAAFMQLWTQDQVDAAAVHARIAQSFDARRAYADDVADALIRVHGILTPEQRAKVGKMIAERSHGRMHGEKAGRGAAK